ncbi:MAG: autotransporter-associated beta strand repeat-containing protein [Kiritimatiellae bacterium]|nr:autotransporter-associated beta strand repeat-containing protein [Kiritimatiellia bacterium]
MKTPTVPRRLFALAGQDGVSRRLGLAAVAAWALAGPTRAAERTFTANNADFHTPANWSDSAVPGVGDTGIIAGVEGTTRTARFRSNLPATPDAIRIQPYGVLQLYDAHMANEHNLVVEGGRFSTRYNYNSFSTVSLCSTSYFSSASGYTLGLYGVVKDAVGSKGTMIVDAGNVAVGGTSVTNAYSGGTQIGSGAKLNVYKGANGSSVLGSGPIELLPGGTLSFGYNGDVFITNEIVISGARLQGANNDLYGPNIRVNGYADLNTDKAMAECDAVFRDYDATHPGRLIKTGSGTWRVKSVSSTYSGGTRVQSGTLVLASSATGSMPDTGMIQTDTGATMDFNGQSDTIGGLSGDGTNSLGSGAAIVICAEGVAPGTNGTNAATLTLTGSGRLTLGAAAESVFRVRSTSDHDQVRFTDAANLTLDGEVRIETLGARPEAGEYVLFDLASGAADGAFLGITTPNGWNGSVIIRDGDVILRLLPNGTVIMLR